MNEYLIAKAEFIRLSKLKHLVKNQYDTAFQLAADCVREVFKVEPVAYGSKRSTLESRSTQALIGIMKSLTEINDTELAKMLKKSDHTSVYYNYKKHIDAYATDEKYRNKYNQALVNYILN